MLLSKLINLYSLVVLGSIIVSWLGLPTHHPVVRFFTTLTEPLLSPIRRVIPPFAGLDFSPMVLLIGLQVFKKLLFI